LGLTALIEIQMPPGVKRESNRRLNGQMVSVDKRRGGNQS